MKPNSAIKIIRANEGNAVWAMGEKLNFKLNAEDTGGAFCLAEVTAQPRNGPPPHIHHREDEFFYVLDGEFAFTLGDRTFTRSKGFAACLPKGVIHTYSNVGSRPGKLLVLAAPAGFERFIRAWSRPVRHHNEPPPAPSPQDVENLLAAATEFGIEIRPDTKAMPDASVPPADPSYWVMGQYITLKLNSPDTAGQLSVAEIICHPGTSVLNHIHVAMDELFYVLEGTAEFTFGDHVEYLEPGGLVFIPRGELHGFRNTGNQPVKLFDFHTPAGFENFFREAGVLATNPHTPPPPGPKPDLNQLIPFLRKHGMEIPAA